MVNLHAAWRPRQNDIVVEVKDDASAAEAEAQAAFGELSMSPQPMAQMPSQIKTHQSSSQSEANRVSRKPREESVKTNQADQPDEEQEEGELSQAVPQSIEASVLLSPLLPPSRQAGRVAAPVSHNTHIIPRHSLPSLPNNFAHSRTRPLTRRPRRGPPRQRTFRTAHLVEHARLWRPEAAPLASSSRTSIFLNAAGLVMETRRAHMCRRHRPFR